MPLWEPVYLRSLVGIHTAQDIFLRALVGHISSGPTASLRGRQVGCDSVSQRGSLRLGKDTWLAQCRLAGPVAETELRRRLSGPGSSACHTLTGFMTWPRGMWCQSLLLTVGEDAFQCSLCTFF